MNLNKFSVVLNDTTKALADKNKILRLIGQEMKTTIDRRFQQGVDPNNQKWKPSRRSKMQGGKTLMDTSALKHSFSIKISGNEVACGTNLKYAKIHNFGGVINAKAGKYLTVPIDPSAVGKSARNTPDLFVIKSKKGKPLLVQKGTVGLRVMYLLTKSVTMPARPFIGINQEMIEKFEKIENDIILGAVRKYGKG